MKSTKPAKSASSKSVKVSKAKVVSKPRKASAKKAAVRKTAAKAPKAAVKTQKTQKQTTSGPFEALFSFKGLMQPLPNTQPTEMTMTTGNKQFDQLTQDLNAMGRESIEAFIKSGTVFAKGFEELLRASASIAQETAEKQAAYTQEIMSSKSLNDYASVQSKIAKLQMEEYVQNASKLSEMSAKLLNDTAAPLNEQASKAVKKASQSMAA